MKKIYDETKLLLDNSKKKYAMSQVDSIKLPGKAFEEQANRNTGKVEKPRYKKQKIKTYVKYRAGVITDKNKK